MGFFDRFSANTSGHIQLRRVYNTTLPDLANIVELPIGLTPPQTPTLSGSVIDWISINLTWSTKGDEMYWILEEDTGSGFTPTLTLTDPSLTLSNFDPSETRSYRIRAYSSSDMPSSYSNVVELTTLELPAPVITLDSVGLESAEISWTSFSESTEYGFSVERSLVESSGFSEVGTTSTNVLVFSDLGPLDHGTTYYWRVRAQRNGVYSDYSNTVSGVTATMDAPSNLVATPAIGKNILTWVSNSENEEDGFSIESSLDGVSGWSSFATVGTGVETVEHTGLMADQTWFYRVIATESEGSSMYSNIANATVPRIDPPSYLFAVPGVNLIGMAWSDPSNLNEGFEVEFSADGVSGWASLNIRPQDVKSYTHTPIAKNQTVYYRVKVLHPSGDSFYSPIASATVTESYLMFGSSSYYGNHNQFGQIE